MRCKDTLFFLICKVYVAKSAFGGIIFLGRGWITSQKSPVRHLYLSPYFEYHCPYFFLLLQKTENKKGMTGIAVMPVR